MVKAQRAPATPVHSPATVLRRVAPRRATLPSLRPSPRLSANCTREPGCADHVDSLHVLPSGIQPPQIVGRRRRFAKSGRWRWSGDKWGGRGEQAIARRRARGRLERVMRRREGWGTWIARSCVRASAVIARRGRGGKHCTVRLAGPEAAGLSLFRLGLSFTRREATSFLSSFPSLRDFSREFCSADSSGSLD